MSVHEVAKTMGWSYRYDEWIAAGGPHWKDVTGALRTGPTVDDMLVWLQERGWPLDVVYSMHTSRGNSAYYQVTCFDRNSDDESAETHGEAPTLWEALAQVVMELGPIDNAAVGE